MDTCEVVSHTVPITVVTHCPMPSFVSPSFRIGWPRPMEYVEKYRLSPPALCIARYMLVQMGIFSGARRSYVE